MRSFVNVYLNDDDIRYLQKDARLPVAAGATLCRSSRALLEVCG